MKARGVLFAMKEAVKAKIDRMEKDGILKFVPYSEWASSIVFVSKPFGTIRICADYTVNLVIKNDSYRQPTPEDYFRKYKEAKDFPKLI